MDSINKESLIAGLIGGVTSLALAFAIRKAVFKHKRGKWMRNRPQAEVVTM